MACPNARLFAHSRERTTLDPSLAEAMVLHLSEPCSTCWRTIDGLPALAIPDAVPSQGRPKLPASEDPMVLALRTVGGWPPRQWLRPERREALGRVRRPFGFLRLVIEEARAWAPLYGHGRWHLERCLDLLAKLCSERHADLDIDTLHAHAMLYLAQVHARHTPATASEFLGRASILHDRAFDPYPEEPSSDALFDARQLGVQAALAEKLGPDFAHQEYQLAAARLVEKRHAEHRVEIMLQHADFLIRSGRFEEAHPILDEAQRRLDRAGAGDLLEQSILHHRCTLALAESLAAPRDSVTRVARLAEARGILARTRPLGLEFDPAITQHRARLFPRFEDEGRGLGSPPRCTTQSEIDDLLDVWDHYYNVRPVRRILTPALDELFGDSPRNRRPSIEDVR